jgi:hypothetical protein
VQPFNGDDGDRTPITDGYSFVTALENNIDMPNQSIKQIVESMKAHGLLKDDILVSVCTRMGVLK